MWRVSTDPTATAGRSGLNWKKFSLSMRSVSQYSRAAFDLLIDRATSSPVNPPPRIRRRFFCMASRIPLRLSSAAMDERRKGFLGGVAFYPWLIALIAVLVAGVHIVVTNRVRADLGRTRAQVATLTRDLEAERRWALALASPGVRTASFTLTPSGDLSLRARA